MTKPWFSTLGPWSWYRLPSNGRIEWVRFVLRVFTLLVFYGKFSPRRKKDRLPLLLIYIGGRMSPPNIYDGLIGFGCWEPHPLRPDGWFIYVRIPFTRWKVIDLPRKGRQ